jgi:hypothetical protein
LKRSGLLSGESLPDHLSAAVADRGHHFVDVSDRGDQDDCRARAGHSFPQLIDKQLRFRVGLARLAYLRPDERADRHPDGQAGWPEEDADHRPAGKALARPPLRDVEGLVDIDIVPRERPAQHQVAIVVVLDKTYLAGPRRVAAGPITRSYECFGGRAPTVKSHYGKIKIHAAESTAPSEANERWGSVTSGLWRPLDGWMIRG